MTESCRRCGECCRSGGPVLHTGDLELFQKKVLDISDLVMIRKGEPAIDPLTGRVIRAAAAMLKIGGRASDWSCRFFSFDPPACRIHGQSPLECRLLFCRAPEPLKAVVGRDLLPLAVVPGVSAAMAGVAHDFDHDFPFVHFNSLVGAVIDGSGSVAGLETLINKEVVCRLKLCRAHHISTCFEVAIIGRPFFISVTALGLRIRETPTGFRVSAP